METKPVSNRMYSLIVLYDMHTNFLAKALDGITEKDAQNRLNTKANHIAWLTGSLVQQRFEIAKNLGVEHTQAANELFKDNKGIQDNVSYPSLADFKKDWDIISPQLREAFVTVTDERLDRKFEMMPGYIIPFFDLLTFMIYREANIIGQIALWRRLLGYEGMKYM
ncbi:MAG: DinB family protein [Chitinophagaceae bacterium]|nr:DinB family protein [Chitinophagaceae bacterium]